jgi:hypothetical protein
MRQGELQVCKTSLSDEANRDVDLAVKWSKELTRMEARGPGDMPNAWRRLEARYGVEYGTFWALRYRRPAAIFSHILRGIESAYRAECARQARLLAHEAAIAEAALGPDHVAVRQSKALVGDERPS